MKKIVSILFCCLFILFLQPACTLSVSVNDDDMNVEVYNNCSWQIYVAVVEANSTDSGFSYYKINAYDSHTFKYLNSNDYYVIKVSSLYDIGWRSFSAQKLYSQNSYEISWNSGNGGYILDEY